MNNNDLLKLNFEYYKDNHKEIIKEYLNKYIIIQNQKIIASYDTFEEAIADSSKKYELGTFIIQKCSQDLNEQTQVFHSRVL